jgi:5-hydroxyisourate hydrolase
MEDIKQDRRDFMLRGLLDEPTMDRRDFLGAGLAIGAMGAAGTLALGPETAHAQAGVGRLTCHALDTYSGRPAGGMRVNLSIQEGTGWKLLKNVMTVDSGRTAEPLMTGEGMLTGNFMLEFFHSEYFKARAFLPNPPFYDRVVHFLSVPNKSATYHITLVAAPWGYTTFRWKE